MATKRRSVLSKRLNSSSSPGFLALPGPCDATIWSYWHTQLCLLLPTTGKNAVRGLKPAWAWRYCQEGSQLCEPNSIWMQRNCSWKPKVAPFAGGGLRVMPREVGTLRWPSPMPTAHLILEAGTKNVKKTEIWSNLKQTSGFFPLCNVWVFSSSQDEGSLKQMKCLCVKLTPPFSSLAPQFSSDIRNASFL